MSITFGAALSPISGFTFTCGHENGMTEHRFGSYQDALSFLQAEHDAHGFTGGLAVCGDVDYCGRGPMHIEAIESDPAPSLNVTGTNAVHLLGLLGLPTDFEDGLICGSTDPEDFLGRVLLAQAVNPADAGVPVTERTGNGGMTLIQMGLRAGYSEDRLAELRELADFAVSRGRTIQWC